MVERTVLFYFGAISVLYAALSISLVVKFITYRTAHVPPNNTGWKFDDVAKMTCGGDCSLIHLIASGNCKLKCSVTPGCECYHRTPLIPSACFLYRGCGPIQAPAANDPLKYYFGVNRVTVP